MFEHLFNYQDPTKDVDEAISVEVDAEGKLILSRHKVISVDISGLAGCSMALKIADAYEDPRWLEAVTTIRREVAKSILRQTGDYEGETRWR